jgi:hypothetical protein
MSATRRDDSTTPQTVLHMALGKKKRTQLFFAILQLFSPRSIHWHHSGQRHPRQE